jgi:copper chaperone CopZ
MTHTYTIEGMTCNGCRTDVENKLNQIGAVLKATVNLEEEEAVIEMNKHISILELQNSLPSKYNIIEKASKVSTIVIDEKSQLQQLFPLFLIFGYIGVAAILLNYKSQGVSGFMLDFMGLFYVVFSFFKLLDLKGFPDSFRMYDPIAKKIPLYGWIYPFIEVGLGLLFLMRIQLIPALIITIIILGITTIGVTKVLLDKKSIQCACLGTALKLPMTKATFIENTVMLVMAVVMLVQLFNN